MNQEMIVIVEDEPQIAQLLIDYLQASGYQTQHFTNGQGVIEWVKRNAVGCVLLDIMLPEADRFGDGLQLCREIREFSQVPIMMLTARVEEIDRILGLELGADDYLCKPFSPREVVARVKALLRRSRLVQSPTQESSQWHLDEGTYQVHYQQNNVQVSAVEFAILRTLSHSPGRIFSRAQLIDSIYSDHRVVSDRTIDSHIKKLRQKLSTVFGENDWIQSVYGVGYKFVLGSVENS
ncbi:response regulator [Thiomicrorhabdus sp. 6S2-11]|jgi:two-component system response regulator BaeR|uniref:Response regulator n=1 Tax=Thiomicrorhabdus marina TaxID=2818442 RepID=A0ABS3Q6X7_9GAMM|nr:response regulator [Thiomicrorhabdus marina]MBO1928108.1 response regulator [Thiomicrorhabdus marina]